MAKTFADSRHLTLAINGDYLLAIQAGNTLAADGGLEEMLYVKASELRAFMREGMASVYNYRGEFSTIPTDLAVGDTFYAATSFSEGGKTYYAGHLYAYNGTSWDDITDILTQYAKQGDLEALSDDVDAIDDRLTQAEAEIAAFSGGIVFKGETTSANLPAADPSNKGWMYYVTDLGKYKVSDGTQWVDYGSYPIEAYALRSSFPVTGEGQKLYIALDEKKIYWWDGSTYVSDTSKMAEIDGYYQEMGVGTAEQLVSTQNVEDSGVYLFRTSGGSADIGNREDDEIVGGTLGVNQIFKTNTKTHNGVTTTYNPTTGIVSLTGEMTTSYASCFDAVPKIDNHIYLLSTFNVINPNNIEFMVGCINNNLRVPIGTSNILSSPYSQYNTWGILSDVARDVTGISFGFIVIDLTSMFGSEIANHILSLEQANAGAGVAWFRRYFPKPYYSYNAGVLASVKPSSHDMRGFNAWDEEWESGQYSNITGEKIANGNYGRSKNFIPVIPSQYYYFKIPTSYGQVMYFAEYDANKNFLRYGAGLNNAVQVGSDCHYITIWMYGWTSYNHDVCINLSWSGTRNGEYEPFELHSYPLDDSTEYRGIPKLDEEGNLYFDGDIYKSSGDVTRKKVAFRYNGGAKVEINGVEYGIPTFSDSGQIFQIHVDPLYTKKFIANTADQACSFNGNEIKNPYQYGNNNLFCWFESGEQRVAVKIDGLSSVADYKTYFASNPLAFVATYYDETTEQVAPFTNPQIVNDWGTEEYVDTRDMPIPVGHNTKYMANLRDKLQHLPNLANADGEYVVKQTGTQMELVKTDNLKKDGYYPTLAVGTADNLKGKGTVGADFTFRTAGGSADIGSGSARIDSIEGNTLMLNQKVKDGKPTSLTNWGVSWGAIPQQARGSFELSNGAIHANTTQDVTDVYLEISNMNNFDIIKGHKIVFLGDVTSQNQVSIIPTGTASQGGYSLNVVTTVIRDTVRGNCRLRVFTGTGVTATLDIRIKNIMFIDLTQMFGAGNEPNTLAEFKALFPLDYYDYTEGTPLNFKGTGLKTDGFNQWDEVWEQGLYNPVTGAEMSGDTIRGKNYIKVFPNTQYYGRVSQGSLVLFAYDENKQFINHFHNTSTSPLFTIPSGCHYIRFYCQNYNSIVYKNDVCINISWSGIRNGEYEPYWDSTLDLPITTVKGKASGSDESVVIFPDGMMGISYGLRDELNAKKGIVRMAMVDLGSLYWNILGSNAHTFWVQPSSFPIAKGARVMCTQYGDANGSTLNDSSFDKSISSPDSGTLGLRLHDTNISASDIVDGKIAKLNGVMMVYPLVDPIEYTLDEELNLNYRVDDFGTEQLLPENGSTPTTAPLIAEIAYAMNAVDTLRNLDKNFTNLATLDGLIAIINSKCGVNIVRGNFDSANNKYTFS